jgi:hypothetical protein
MLLLALVSFQLLAPVASSYPTVNRGAHQPQIQWIDCRNQVPLSVNLSSSIDLNNLPSTLHCGEITVPMDYAKSISAENNITLGLAMYGPSKKPQGIIFLYAKSVIHPKNGVRLESDPC